MPIDSMDALGKVYRPWGIDAPETKQDCPDDWPADRLESAYMPTVASRRGRRTHRQK